VGRSRRRRLTTDGQPSAATGPAGVASVGAAAQVDNASAQSRPHGRPHALAFRPAVDAGLGQRPAWRSTVPGELVAEG